MAAPEGRNLDQEPDEELLTPAEAAKLFRVDPKTVANWAKAGMLPCIYTLGGHRRYPADEVQRLLEGNAIERQDDDPGPEAA